MNIEPFFDEKTQTLSYVVSDEATRDAVIIDPVLDYEPAGGLVTTESVERLASYVERAGLKVHWVLETHPHADHLSGGHWLKKRFNAPLAISRRITEVQSVFKGVFGWPDFKADGSQFDRLLDDGDVVRAGSLELKVVATPGHTPACVTYRVGDDLFTGDTLLHDDVGVGRCDFPKGDASVLFEAVTSRLYALPAATRIFPGHDYPPAGRTWKPSTTIGEAREKNVQLKAAQAKEDFVEKRTARDKTLSAPRLLYPSVQVNIAAGRLPEPEANGRRYFKTPIKAD